MTGPTLLTRFEDEDWAGGTVEAWLGRTPPSGVPVSSACLMVTTPGRLLLAEVRQRGWDLPGGHLEDGESPPSAVLRELTEETGIEPDELTAPEVLGWFTVDDAIMLVLTAQLTVGERAFQPRMPDEIQGAEFFPLTYLPAGSAERIWFPFVEHLDDTP